MSVSSGPRTLPIMIALLASTLGFTALYFWLHNLQRRLAALRDRLD